MPKPTTSLAQHVRPFDAGAHVVAAAFLDEAPALALADGAVLIGEPDEQKRVEAHPDAAILTAVGDGKTFLTGGDDGRVVGDRRRRRGARNRRREGPLDRRARACAAAPSPGAPASRSARATKPARSGPGARRRRVRGLAFQPKGYRLAATHYNGVSLWFPKVEGAPQTLEWKGAHLDATFSPDGRFLVTSMQENALHGWRLADSRNMRMTGYPGKTRSLSWSHDGAWLATSGADAAVVWPFKDKDGPMGKAPRECGVREARVTKVAFHPRALVVAIGYADGLVLLCRLADGAEILVRRPGGGPVSALGWDASGRAPSVRPRIRRGRPLTLPG